MPISTCFLVLLLVGILAVTPVTARAANCTLSSRAMAFGNYNPLNGAALNRAARATIWGDGTGCSVTVTQAFNNNRVRLSVYGRIPAMEDMAPGSDTDHITAIVTF